MLIVLDNNELKNFCKLKNIVLDEKNLKAVYNNPSIINHLRQEIKHACLPMKPFERPQKFFFLEEPFSQENQMMTPKMSLRRRNIMQRYSDLINQLYSPDNLVGNNINS